MRVVGVVLAAGAGRRFGMPKALAELDGELLVDRASRILAAGCDPVLVVLGASATEVRARARLDGASVVENPEWAGGMGSSLRVGLEGASDEIDAALVLPVDMPGVTEAAVRRVAAHAAPDALVAASYGGVRGHPVLLGRDHWPGIRRVATGDSGARDYLRTRHVALVACDDVAAGWDVDHPGDLESDTS